MPVRSPLPKGGGSAVPFCHRHRRTRQLRDHAMSEMFSTLGTWNWLIFGILLMALELLAPGIFLFWLGLAALLVGLLSLAIHPSWQMQILMFAIFAAPALPPWRRLARRNQAASPNEPSLEQGARRPADRAV